MGKRLDEFWKLTELDKTLKSMTSSTHSLCQRKLVLNYSNYVLNSIFISHQKLSHI